MTRYYEDIEIGRVEESSRRIVSKDEILKFARDYDPQYFHADEKAAERSRFGSVIASGVHTIALWRQLDHEIAQDIAWICGVAWDDVRWPHAVFAGDELRARAECIEKRLSDSDDSRGVVTFLYTLLNQDDQIVFSCRSINLIERRPEGMRT